MQHALAAAAAIVAMGLAACAGSPSGSCEINADCASGFCRADHTCAPDDSDGDAGTIDADPDQPDGPAAGCSPDHDGTIRRDELPLTPSLTWSVDTTITGLAQGFSSFYTESYESRVDALGTMDTPYGAFPVSRVAVDLTRNTGVISTRRSFAFIAECYSTIATVVSQDYEDGAEFTDAAEVRRLAP
jgi:hypothetical protein